MRHQRNNHCTVCGPFTEDSVMVEFQDSDGDYQTICVDCLTGILNSIDMPAEATQAWIAAWASEVLSTNVSVVSDDADTH